jgi:hypothetical protein
MKTKILITVKTYPSISTKYKELVCTAGFTENGNWIRIYPVPFRKLDYSTQYKKYDWIELDLEKNTSDFRPESYRTTNPDHIKICGHVDTDHNWAERKKLVLGKVYHDLSELIKEARDKKQMTSLAVFKPSKIIDFTYESTERDWPKNKKEIFNQLNIFEKAGEELKIIKKLPYKFSYVFQDIQGTKSKLMIEDWETGQLYWRMRDKYPGDEKKACEYVRNKYMEDFAKTTDLHFFLGTTKEHHFVAKNPFIIIGTFHPKIVMQTCLDF